MDKKATVFVMPFILMFGLGTEGIQTVVKYLKVAERYGVRLIHGVNLWLILIDDHWTPPRDLELKYYTPQTLHSLFIPASLVDKESRLHLRVKGKLWMLDEESVLEPGVRSESSGTGNEQVWGRALVLMNEPQITRAVEQGMRRFQDHQRRLEEARQGEVAAYDGVLHTVFTSNTAGGFSGGAELEMLRITSASAARLHVPLKTHVHVLDLGTLFPANRNQAIANRGRKINLQRILSTGAYRDIERPDGVPDGPLVNYLQVCPNAGQHGELRSLDLHEWMFAQHTFLKFNSPMSLRLREDAVDVEANRGLDEAGAPRIGSAMGSFVISLDREAYHRYCSKVMVSRFAHAVLGAPATDAVEQGTRAAGELSFVESYAESQTVRRLAHAAGGEPDMYQEALGGFADRFAGLSGLRALQAIDAAYQTVTSQLIPEVIQSRARERALSMTADLQKRVAKEKAAYANDLFGPRRLRGWTGGFLNTVEESMRVSAEKAEATALYAEAIHQGIDACHRRTAEFSQMGQVGRLFHYFSIRASVRRYRNLAERAIRLAVDRMVRAVAQEEVLLPAREYLRGELASQTLLEGKIQSVAEDSERAAEATRKAGASPDRASVGLELADDVALRRFLERTLSAKGGEAAVIQRISATATKSEKSLFALFDRGKDDLAERLSAYAGEQFEADVKSLNVLHLFNERYGKAVTGLLAHAVRSSRPWIRTVGEAGLHIPVVKLLGIPEDCEEKTLVETLRQVDHLDGDWEVVRIPADYDSVILLTYRSRVSLTMLLGQQRPVGEPPSLDERILQSAEKLAAIIPEGRLTEADARVTALYAHLTGLLSRSGADGWRLRCGSGDMTPVGESPESVHSFFRTHFTDTVRVYASLWQMLRGDGSSLEERLRGLARSWSEDKTLRGLISDNAVERAREEVRLMLPFARAMNGSERT